ncbi:MAG: Pvc16 family protein [Nostoc sp.]|uniref:Pvc16 family protein n=1 Tax=Nostoc sp. TaxID=1180 RepID=UPI002FFC7603
MIIFILQTLAGILAGGTSLSSTEQIEFSHPSNRKEEGGGSILNLYVYDIRESKQIQHSGRQVERKLTQALQPASVNWSPTWFDVSMLLTAWDRTALSEHYLLSQALSLLLRHRALKEEFLVPELRGYGNLNMTVAVEPQIEAGSLWSALTIALRPALYLMVTVPVEPQVSLVSLVWQRTIGLQNNFQPELELENGSVYRNGSIESFTKRVVVAGIVKNAVTNLPMKETKVKVIGTEKSTTTNKEGLFYFEDLRNGNYVLQINSPGYLPRQVNALVDGLSCTFKEISLNPA